MMPIEIAERRFWIVWVALQVALEDSQLQDSRDCKTELDKLVQILFREKLKY